MIQTNEQYEFLHQALCMYDKRLPATPTDWWWPFTLAIVLVCLWCLSSSVKLIIVTNKINWKKNDTRHSQFCAVYLWSNHVRQLVCMSVTSQMRTEFNVLRNDLVVEELWLLVLWILISHLILTKRVETMLFLCYGNVEFCKWCILCLTTIV